MKRWNKQRLTTLSFWEDGILYVVFSERITSQRFILLAKRIIAWLTLLHAHKTQFKNVSYSLYFFSLGILCMFKIFCNEQLPLKAKTFLKHINTSSSSSTCFKYLFPLFFSDSLFFWRIRLHKVAKKMKFFLCVLIVFAFSFLRVFLFNFTMVQICLRKSLAELDI